MQEKKITLIYKGTYKQFLECQGFIGHITPGQQIEVGEQAFNELKEHDDYEVVKPIVVKPEIKSKEQNSDQEDK